jgi:hypothetical protein
MSLAIFTLTHIVISLVRIRFRTEAGPADWLA